MKGEFIDINQLDFENHMSQSVVIIEKDNSIIIDDTIHMCVTLNTSDDLMIKFLNKYKNSNIKKYYSIVGHTLDNMLHSDAKYLALYGFSDEALVLQRSQVETLSDFIDSFVIVYSHNNHKLPLDKTYEYLKNKKAYYINNEVSYNSYLCVENDVLDADNTKSDTDTSQSLMVFLSKNVAEIYADTDCVILSDTIENILKKWQDLNQTSIIIEPHTDYWIKIE